MAWLTDGAVTDQMLTDWEAWMDREADQAWLREVNPGRLGDEQIAQITAAAIQRLARDPGDRFLEDVVEDLLPLVEAAVAAVPARPEAGDPEVSPASVVTNMVDEYLVARQGWGWPAGRASAWAVGHVVDRARTLGMAAVDREEGFSASAAQAEWDLGERTRAARAVWEAQDREPWLRADVDALLATAPSPDRIPTELFEQARTTSTGDLLAWVDAVRHLPARPLLLEFSVACDAAEQIRHHLDEERAALRGLWGQLAKTGPWWWPGTWRRRADLRARIAERARVVIKLQQRFDEADERVLESLPGKQQAADKAWEVQRRQVLEQAAAAAQELRLREQGLLDDRMVDPPGYLLEALGCRHRMRPAGRHGRLRPCSSSEHAPRAWLSTEPRLAMLPAVRRRRCPVRMRTGQLLVLGSPRAMRRAGPSTSQFVAMRRVASRPTISGLLSRLCDLAGWPDRRWRRTAHPPAMSACTAASRPQQSRTFPSGCRRIRGGGSRRTWRWRRATPKAAGWSQLTSPSTSQSSGGSPSKDAQVRGREWSTSCPRTLPGWQWRSLPDCRPIISGQDLTCQRMTLVMTAHWTDPAGCPSHPPPLR